MSESKRRVALCEEGKAKIIPIARRYPRIGAKGGEWRALRGAAPTPSSTQSQERFVEGAAEVVAEHAAVWAGWGGDREV